MATKFRSILVATLGALLTVSAGAEQAAQPAKTPPPQQHFASPEAAAAALVAAVKAGDQPALLAVLGKDSKPLVDSGDPIADHEAGERFVESYEAIHTIETPSAGRAVLATGKDSWPFPIPIVKEAAGWHFDTVAGHEEIIDRRIGRNERFTIQTCLAVVDAQRDYYAENPDKDPILHYARHFLSSAGKRDGLYYKTAEDEPDSPLGSLAADAQDRGYTKDKAADSFHGYNYRMLDAQGPHASDGAYSYLADGQMFGGFALVAFPSTYDNSGVMTFIVNQDGVVYQKDLGPDTEKLARAIERYDPDQSWQRVPEEYQAPGTDTETN